MLTSGSCVKSWGPVHRMWDSGFWILRAISCSSWGCLIWLSIRACFHIDLDYRHLRSLQLSSWASGSSLEDPKSRVKQAHYKVCYTNAVSAIQYLRGEYFLILTPLDQRIAVFASKTLRFCCYICMHIRPCFRGGLLISWTWKWLSSPSLAPQ